MIQKKTGQTNGSRPARTSGISERKRAEEALRESERRFRDVAENALAWIWEVDADGIYTYASPMVEQILGYKPDEMLGKHFHDLFHPEDRQELKKAASGVFASKQPFRGFLNRNVHKNGQTVWLSTSGVPMLDQGGNLLGYRGADTDITERKQAEEALRASEETYRAIFNATNDGILVHDMETGEIVDANAAFLDQHGCTSEEARQFNVVPLGSGEAPYTQEDALRWIHKAARGEPQRFEWQSKDRDGRRIWLDMTLERATIAGQDRVLAISRDITERKQAEEALQESERRFRTLSEASFEGIAIHDKGRILAGNRALATMFGYELSEVIGMHALDLTAPESRDVLLRHIASKQQEPFELTGLKKDGTTFPAEGLGSPIPYRGKRVTVAAIRDITERKRAEEAFQKAREELESRVERQMERGNPYGLSFRELTILHLVAAGKADKEIGFQLGISPLTTHKHLGSILSKMGAASRTEASVRALREGLLD